MDCNNLDSIRKMSRNWTLEGDCLFLNLMSDISKQLEFRAEECLENLNSMSNNLEKTFMALENITNKLSALQNTQFIENRVYDDDETVPILKTDETADQMKSDDYNPIKTLDIILNNNLRMMDKYHEKVSLDLNESDEEDVDRNKNTVYRSKTLYEMHPLPHIFWTKKWKETSHVGICDSDEDFSDGETEEYSDSDSDNTSLPSRTGTISESGSSLTGLLPSNNVAPKLPVYDGKPVRPALITNSHDVENYYIHKPKLKTDQTPYADEEVDISRSNVSKRISPQKISNLFYDEPPELDETDRKSVHSESSKKIFYEKTNQSDPKDRGQNEKNQNEKIPSFYDLNQKKVNLFENDEQDDDFDKLITVLSQNPRDLPIQRNYSKNLFDSDEDTPPKISNLNNSNEVPRNSYNSIEKLSPIALSTKKDMLPTTDLFAEKPVTPIEEFGSKHSEDQDKQPILSNSFVKKYSLGLFDEEPPEDEFDILFNSASDKDTLKQNSSYTKSELASKTESKNVDFNSDSNNRNQINDPSKFGRPKNAPKQTSRLDFQTGKLFDSESEDDMTSSLQGGDSFSQPVLGNKTTAKGSLGITNESNSDSVNKNRNQIKSLLHLRSKKLFDSDSEEEQFDSKRINNVPSKSSDPNIFAKSKLRVDKLFDSESEEEASSNNNQNANKQNKMIFDSHCEEKKIYTKVDENEQFLKTNNLNEISTVSSNLSRDEHIGESNFEEKNNFSPLIKKSEFKDNSIDTTSVNNKAFKSKDDSIFTKSKIQVHKLFESESEEETTSSNVISDDQNIIKQKDNLFDSDLEEKPLDTNVNEDGIFDLIKKTDMDEPSKAYSNISNVELFGENVEKKTCSSLIKELEPNDNSIAVTSPKNETEKSLEFNIPAKSKMRVDKLFDSDSEEETISIDFESDKQKYDMLFESVLVENEFDKNESKNHKFIKKTDLNEVSSNLTHDKLVDEGNVKNNSLSKQSEPKDNNHVTADKLLGKSKLQNDIIFDSDPTAEQQQNSTTNENQSITFSSDHPVDDFFSLHKKENSLDKIDTNLHSSQLLSGNFVSVGLFEDIPPDDDNDALLITNHTKRINSVFYDDFADAIPSGVSNNKLSSYSYNIFDEEPPPDTKIEKSVSSPEKNENTSLTVTRNESKELPDISPQLKTAEFENEGILCSTSNKLPTPKKLSKTKLNINVHALMGGTNIKAIQNATKKQSSNDIIEEKLRKTDKHLGEVPTLAHMNKHRAKLPVTRRPSTRVGRQENYKKFVTNNEEKEHKSLKNQNTNKDERRISGSMENKPIESKSSGHLNFKPGSVVFGSDEDIFAELKTDDDLFANSETDKSVAVTKKLQPLNTPIALFSSDEDDDGGLFKKHSLLNVKKPDTTKAKIKQQSKSIMTQKPSLFNEDSDDDLFQTQVSERKSKLVEKNRTQKLPKNSLALKLDSSTTSDNRDNPLADLLSE